MKWSKEEALKCVLRTHTTVLSARTLYKNKRGKFFAIGRVFRNEAIDYKHLAEFHQVEGIIADEQANFRHLLGILKEFFSKLGFDKIRFRPSFFPYTEPSLEIEVYFDKKKDWIEIGGAGIFREEVTRPLGCVYPVLAFGLSLERPLMMLMGLEDIREFYVNDFSIYEKQLQF
jgi:phenylalanyl-tRNA synthetase alpha chain